MSSEEILLSLRGISKIYQTGETAFYALNNIDLDIYAGEFLAILGPSGSGKSTLINIIGGIDRPTLGKINFLDLDLSKASENTLTTYRRNNIGFIFQFYNLLPTLTAIENVEVAVEISAEPLDALATLDMVGIKNLADKFPAQMSGGEQQRVAIARALASNPKILLCDEPTGALDSKNSEKVLALLADLNRRLHKTIVFLTHNRDLLKPAGRVLEIKDGKIDSIAVK